MSHGRVALTVVREEDATVSEKLLPLVYEELRKLATIMLAREKSGQALQATDLVHEASVKLIDTQKVQHWDSRRHFFAAAAETMRRILIQRVRQKERIKRGGGRLRIDLDRVELAVESSDDEVMAVNEAIEKLEASHAVCAELVKLRFFVGLRKGEAAAALELSPRTADRYWSFARAWLRHELKQGDDD